MELVLANIKKTSPLERAFRCLGLVGVLTVGISGCATTGTPSDSYEVASSVQRKSAYSDAFPYAVSFTTSMYDNKYGSVVAENKFDEIAIDFGRVYVLIQWRGLRQETYLAELRVFDGAGYLVKASKYRFKPKSSNWRIWWPYDLDADGDRPGIWRFEVDLDGETLVERQLVVTSTKDGSARSGASEASLDAAFHAYQTAAPKFKVFVRAEDGAWAWRVRQTFYSAKREAIQACDKRAKEAGQRADCRIYAAGDDIVWEMPEREREHVIKAYSEL